MLAAHSSSWMNDATRLHAGDLLTALLLAWLDKLPGDLAAAVEHALAGLQGVLQATATACGDVAKTTEHSAQVGTVQTCAATAGHSEKACTRLAT